MPLSASNPKKENNRLRKDDFMKTKIWAVISAALCILLFTSCSMGALMRQSSQKARAENSEASSVVDADGNIRETRFFGTYTIPAGWTEAPEFSTDEKWFYVKDGTDLSSPTSNISVECGTNRYSADQHEAFRQAIVSQLAQQTSAAGSTSMTGTGTSTDAGDVLYVFTIENSDGTTTIQYYIVGDKQYVMVHATDFYDEAIPDLQETARSIAYSFEWA